MPDAPDGTLIVEIGITLGQTSVPVSSATELAATATGTYSGALQTYQTVASWTVTAGKTGVLRAVEMETDTYAKTQKDNHDWFNETYQGINRIYHFPLIKARHSTQN